jgi:AcrR family transcriptional regulator
MRNALLTLVEIKPYEEVSVREIVGSAGVSYTTFFRNYSSKAELLGDIAAEEMRELFVVMIDVFDQRDPALTARVVCDFVAGRRPLWKMLLNSDAVFVMREAFIAVSAGFVENRSRVLPDFPIELSASFFVGSMFEVLSWWLRGDDAVPADRIAYYLETLVMRPTMTPDH